MAETAAHPAHFGLDASILRRDQRILRVALAGYLPAGIILTAAAAWAASQPGDVIAAVLIAVGAVQVDYFVAAAVIACPDSEPEPSCRFTNRTIKFHIDEDLYNTTIDDIASAFARYTAVATSAERA